LLALNPEEDLRPHFDKIAHYRKLEKALKALQPSHHEETNVASKDQSSEESKSTEPEADVPRVHFAASKPDLQRILRKYKGKLVILSQKPNEGSLPGALHVMEPQISEALEKHILFVTVPVALYETEGFASHEDPSPLFVFYNERLFEAAYSEPEKLALVGEIQDCIQKQLVSELPTMNFGALSGYPYDPFNRYLCLQQDRSRTSTFAHYERSQPSTST
jgi:hypothetical protein